MNILIIVLLLIAAVLIYATTRPDTFRLQRAIAIDAAADKVFAAINDFHTWPQWSPWAQMDPQMRVTYSGAPSGKGAIYEWQGNNKVGEGRMEIIESMPNRLIKIKLDFYKPMRNSNITEFIIDAAPTRVTWAMYGPSPYLSKLMTTFVSMDKMVGKDFERGLQNLKMLAEK